MFDITQLSANETSTVELVGGVFSLARDPFLTTISPLGFTATCPANPWLLNSNSTFSAHEGAGLVLLDRLEKSPETTLNKAQPSAPTRVL